MHSSSSMVVENPARSASPPLVILIPTTSNTKRKRRPAGTPDPDAEVVALSPKTLLESDRYVCEICNQGFQRDQNLQMHRRRHKVPWKLVKREAAVACRRKRVFVCPEPSCLHHQPSHALGDLVGIKKHFRRKHSSHKQWVCGKCSKAYAVHSDFKAHLKTCGTRGHSCHCGRVFSRVESFIEHQDACHMGQARSDAFLSRTGSIVNNNNNKADAVDDRNRSYSSMQLQLSIGSSLDLTSGDRNDKSVSAAENDNLSTPRVSAVKEEVRAAMAEKACAEEGRREAKVQVEMAEREYANAARLRQQAQAELNRAQAFKDHAVNQISAALLQITCPACHLHLNK